MLSTSVGTNKKTSVLARPAVVKQYDYSEPTTKMSIYLFSSAESKGLLSFLSFENIILHHPFATESLRMLSYYSGFVFLRAGVWTVYWNTCRFFLVLQVFFSRSFYLEKVSSCPILSHYCTTQISIFFLGARLNHGKKLMHETRNNDSSQGVHECKRSCGRFLPAKSYYQVLQWS